MIVPRNATLPPGTLVLTVAVLGLVTVTATAALTAPTPVTLSDLPLQEGARVTVDARVLTAAPRVVTLADDLARVTAFLPRGHGDPPDPGVEVRAVGLVGRGAAGVSLSLESVRVLAAPADRVLTVGDVARAPERYAGAPVTVEGVLDRAPHAGWRLVDAATGGHVALDASPVPAAWEPGVAVRVDGELSLHARSLTYRVTVHAWTSS